MADSNKAEQTDHQPGSFDRRVFPFFALITLLALINFLAPQAYAFFGLNHLSFLSKPFQIQWILILLGVLFLVARTRSLPIKPWVFHLTALIAILSLFLFRTEFPSVHGNGEAGGSPHFGTFDLSVFPKYDGRLQSMVVDLASRFVPSVIQFDYHFTSRAPNRSTNNTWILTLFLIGIGMILLITRWIKQLDQPVEAKWGLQLLLLTSAPILNAYGHFDSHLFPIALVTLWFLALRGVLTRPRQIENWIFLFGMIPLCTWAHPVLLYLTGYGFIAALLIMLDKAGQKITIQPILILALLYGCAPFLLPLGNRDIIQPENRPLLGALLHEKGFSFIQVALPALVLLRGQFFGKRLQLGSLRPRQSVPLFICISMMIMFLSLKAGYGLLDEFLYSLFGAIFIGGVVLLYLSTEPDPRNMVYCGLLSLFLFFPRVHLYAGPAMLDRFEQNVMHDPSRANRRHGPYKIMGMNMPINTPELRQRRLELFKRGFQTPEPRWEMFRENARAFYIVWSYEFEQPATEELTKLIEEYAEILPALWQENPDPFLTRTWRGVAHDLIRKDSRRILEEKLKIVPGHPEWQQMLDVLSRIELQVEIESVQ